MKKQLLVVITAETALSDEEVMDAINYNLTVNDEFSERRLEASSVDWSAVKFISAVDVTQPETF